MPELIKPLLLDPLNYFGFPLPSETAHVEPEWAIEVRDTVYEPTLSPVVGTNVSFGVNHEGATFTGSPYYWNFSTMTWAKAFDGDPNTYYQSNSPSTNQWLEIHYPPGGPWPLVEQITFKQHTGNYGTTSLRMQYWNGSAWVTHHTFTSVPKGEETTLVVPNPQQAEKIKFISLYNYTYWRVHQLLMLAEQRPPTPLGVDTVSGSSVAEPLLTPPNTIMPLDATSDTLVPEPSNVQDAPTAGSVLTIIGATDDMELVRSPGSTSIEMAIRAYCTGEAVTIAPKPQHQPPLYVRAQGSLHIGHTEPALLKGRPQNPVLWSKDALMSATCASPTVIPDPVYVSPINPDPDPFWPYPESGWRWQAEDIPGTPGVHEIANWPEANGGAPWTSASGFGRPSVALGLDGVTKCARFEHHTMDLLRLDFSSGPWNRNNMTVIVDAVFLSYPYPTARWGHYLMDAADYVGSHRAAMLYRSQHAIAGTHTNNDLSWGNYVKARGGALTGKHRTYFMRFNQGNSHLGYADQYHWHSSGGYADPCTFSALQMGKRWRINRTDYSTHMDIYEVRIFFWPLTDGQISQQIMELRTKYNHGLDWA